MNPEPTKHFRSLPFLIITFIILFGFSVWHYLVIGIDDRMYQVVDEQVGVATSTDEMVGWKVYKKQENGYGFEFKYPENYKHRPFNIRFEVNVKAEDRFPSAKVVGTKQVRIGENDVLRSQIDSEIEPEVAWTFYKEQVSGSGLYTVVTLAPINAIYEDVKNDLESILATFKFMDPLEANQSKVYKNEKHGFEISKDKVVEIEEETGLENFTGLYDYAFFMIGISGCKEGCSNSVAIYVQERDSADFFDDMKKNINEQYTRSYPLSCNQDSFNCVYEIKEVDFAGERAIYIDVYSDPGTYPTHNIEYYVLKNGKTYHIRTSGTDDAEKLISTFKFTN